MSNLETLKQLREKTGAGMGDCKKALDEAGDDIEKAVEILRKKGIAKAAKRGERDASEGIIKLAVNDAGNEAYIVEINAETDFVVRNEKFQALAENVLNIIKEKKPGSLDELLAEKMDSSTVKETIENLSGTIGEKMGVKRFDILKAKGTAAIYSHMGGRIGAIVALDTPEKSELAYDIAMQVAASNPKYVNPEDVSEEEINKEKEIYREQLIKEGKPEEMIDKIMGGKINKFFEEICLVKQEYIKEDKKKVEELLDGIKVEGFVRYGL